MICFLRVDNRLIHGQVVQSWLPQVKAEEVIVISKQAAQNNLMKKMMRLALPVGYALEVIEAELAPELLKKEETKKVFVLVEDLQQLSELVKKGVCVQKVNIGNTKYEEGKKEFSAGVYFGKEDMDIIKTLIQHKISFSIKALPSSMEEKIDA